MRRAFIGIFLIALFALLAFGFYRFFGDDAARKERHLKRGEEYLTSLKFKEAIIEFKNVVAIDPEDPVGYYKLGLAYYRLGGLDNLKSAFSAFERAVELDSSLYEAHLRLGELYLLSGDFDKAKEKAELVLAERSDSLEALILLGRSLAGLKRLDEAVRTLEKAVAIHGSQAAPYVELARVYMVRKDFSKAEKLYRKAVELDRGIGPRLELAGLYSTIGKVRRAEEELREALKVRPDDLTVYVLLAGLYVKEGRPEKAEATLKEAIRKASSDSRYIALADFYIQNKRPEEAVATLEAGLERVPESLPILLRLLDLLIGIGEIEKAKTYVDEALKDNPNSPQLLYVRGRIDILEGRFADAIVYLRRAVKEAPRFYLGHYYLGIAHRLKGEIELAVSEMERALEINPAFVPARIELAALRIASREYGLALEEVEKVLDSDPANFQALIIGGDAYLGLKEFKKAEGMFKRALNLQKDSPLVHYRLGIAYRGQKRIGAAIESFEKALSLDRGFMPPLLELISIDLSRGDVKGASRRVDREIARTENDPFLYYLKGKIYVRAKDYRRAEKAVKKAISMDRDFIGAYMLLGDILAAKGALKEAVEQYKRAADIRPDLPGPYMFLGILYEKMGMIEEAKESYKKALEIDPAFVPAANNLAWLYSEYGGNIDVALTLARQARERLSDNPYVADTLGWIYYKKNSLFNALILLEESAKKLPDNPIVRYHLGMVLYKRGEKERAREELEKALALSRDFPGVEEARETLERLSSAGS